MQIQPADVPAATQSKLDSPSCPHGLLLVGHGTRDEQGLAEFRQVARQVADLVAEFAVEPCFLELAQPDISTAVRRLIDRGARRLTVAPLLLFAAGHAKRDIPLAVQASPAVQSGIDGVVIDQTAPLECHDHIVELSSRRYYEALVDRPPISPDDTQLLLVARGSSDLDAIAAAHRFAELRGRRTPVGRAEVCFAAVAEPSLDAGLRRAAELRYRRVVVQPHLLFAGQVLAQISEAVAEISQIHPQQEWIVAPHLGPSELVAEAIVALVRQAKR